MPDWTMIERTLTDALALRRRPVAVAFLERPPAGVSRFAGTEPSGCSFWRLAGEGRSFYTVPADHANCAVGAHTHNIPLPAERAGEFQQTLTFMTGLGYVRMEEVPRIPQLPRTPGAVVYAPLGDTPVEPQVVLVAGRPGRLMLLHEAALRAGAVSPEPLLARPTCMALPAALATGVVASSGCIGNRIYTGVGEDELWMAVPGTRIGAVTEALAVVVPANTRLAEYHGGRRRELASE